VKKRQKIIVIVGPTASGKSDLAVELAKKINGEVISADSRQVYKGLDIGTGKITKREMKGIPHHLLDVAPPRRKFTAHDFVHLSQKCYSSVLQNNRIPIVVGGTGFYIDALLGNTPLSNVPADEDLRKELEGKTPAQLIALLKRKNPKRAKDIIEKNEQNNKRRIIRAIEIALAHPKCPEGVSGHSRRYEVLWIGIKPEKEKLRERIHERLLVRIRRGMVAEAKTLHAKGLSYRRMEELGLEYRYLARFLKNEITKDEMIEQLSAKIWQYAKRQMTYWRRNKEIKWFLPKEVPKIKKLVSMFLRR